MKRGEYNEIAYTPKELKYRLFGKKSCPLCKSKLSLEREKEYAGEEHGAFGSLSGRSFSKKGDLYRVTEYYRCAKCERRFTLTELAEWGQGI